MEKASVKIQYIKSNSSILKPNYHLNYGKKRISAVHEMGGILEPLGDVVKEVYTGGIFKRIFIPKIDYGIPYISAQHMMHVNPLEVSKIISKKYTPRQDDMILKENQILVSCAGTVGNIRLVTKDMEGIIGSQDIIRIIPNNNKIPFGFLYAYLASKTAYNYIQSFIYGSVVPRIDPKTLSILPILKIDENIQNKTHNLIVEASNSRVKANNLLAEAKKLLQIEMHMDTLTIDDYDYFGVYSKERKVSTFTKDNKEINVRSINAFNYSRRLETIEKRIQSNCETISLNNVLNNKKLFSTGSFPRIELKSPNSIRLINQTDIFNIKIEGKEISKRKVNTDNLVKYGEVLIAGVGTLGENESFCRVIFANEELEGELISGEFIRMKTNQKIPSGYLYAWLSSDYGFRLIRKTQTGTKLCRPIPQLLLEIPIPLLKESTMNIIDSYVKKAHTLRYEAVLAEKQAINLIETEIDSWQN